MDHHEFLRLFHRVTHSMQLKRRAAAIMRWDWACTPVVRPESRCPYCNSIVVSPYIWFLDSDKRRFIFTLPIREGAKLMIPVHPHAASVNGTICRGSHPDGVSVLMNPVTVGQTYLSPAEIPRWYHIYWNHTCAPTQQQQTPTDPAGEPHSDEPNNDADENEDDPSEDDGE